MAEKVVYLENLVNHGRYLEARELAMRLKDDPQVDHLRVDQLLAISLSKSGSPEQALAHLDLAYRRNPEDPETAGILGGVYKDLFRKLQDSKYAILSRDTYSKNFSLTKNYYTGINAATMSAIAGKAVQGREIANAVIALIESTANSVWEFATLGEAYLLIKNRDRSVDYYIKARQSAGNDWGKVLSIHNQLWLLNHYVPVPKEIFRIFAPPVVMAFAGHMVDAPNRATPRFPAVIETKVKDAIKGAIRTLNASIGYCSLACGGDILFAEAMVEEGREVHVLMPFNKSDFTNTSLAFAGEHWVNRFEALQTKYPNTFITQDHYGGNDDLFSLLGKVIFGAAILRSQTYHQEPFLLTVLSEFDMKRREGGTRDTIQMWPYPQRYNNINPDVMYTAAEIVPSKVSVSRQEQTIIPNRPVLFTACFELADVLPMERERIEKLIKSLAGEEQLSFKVYEEQETSIVIGLETEIALMDIVRSVWNSTAPFKPEKPIRIGLHVAPVYIHSAEEDSDIKLLRSITRYAPKGSINASIGFASVLALYPKKFQLDYAGVIQPPEVTESCGLYQVNLK
ncbi:MAG TPA: TRAFs-binding domain-containing protein [Cyclobacteriaceae bacterium]|nr:TRAFs-binding domain-containing protein [Cyclobacteriaceae bacterium]